MPKKPPLSRISITIPADLLKAADRLAAQLDRSRSWVLGEGVRRMSASPQAGRAPAVLQEPATVPYPARVLGLGENRLTQLRADLALSAEQRVLAAEEATRLDQLLRPPGRGQRLEFYDRFEDYLDSKTRLGQLR